MSIFLFKFRYLFGGLFVIASILILLAILPSFVDLRQVKAQEIEPVKATKKSYVSDDPNVVAGGFASASGELGHTINSTNNAINDGMRSATIAAVNAGNQIKSTSSMVGRTVASGAIFAARSIGSGFMAAGNAIGNGLGFVVRLPIKAVRGVSNIHAISHFIRPADHEPVPIIDPKSPALVAAVNALPPEERPAGTVKSAQTNVRPQWPVRGQITTYFGVDHWPFQRTHTGIDISDGTAPGTTPVKPFRPGRVIKTVHTYSGLGNHVILDHGNGVTSVYAHLHSIHVSEGQEVKMDSVLGMQGSTGASTGTHLHFEIRVDGQAADPRQFISGSP